MLTPLNLVWLLSLSISSALGLQCRDENDKAVDWFVLFKIPELSPWPYPIPNIRKGRGYMYITSETLDVGWVISKYSVFQNSTTPGNTLKSYYKNNSSELWLFYNDQPPGERSSKKHGGGHTKGAIGGDKGGGFWLVHSVPHFPPTGAKYGYPGTGVKYGQSFICLSLSASQLDSLGSSVLQYNAPHFYEQRISQEMQVTYPNLYKAASGLPKPQPPYFKKTTLSTLHSLQFQVFAKSKHFSKDLYELVADDLGVDVLTETWRNEEGPMPSSCNSTNKVLNIESISYKGINFNSSHDHSKWAVSVQKEKPWVCIGDINRAVPQEKRGGGTVCLESPGLWPNYRQLAHNVEPCPKKTSPKANYHSYRVDVV